METFLVFLQFKIETDPSAIIKSAFSIEIYQPARVDPYRCPRQIHVDLPGALWMNGTFAVLVAPLAVLPTQQTKFILHVF